MVVNCSKTTEELSLFIRKHASNESRMVEHTTPAVEWTIIAFGRKAEESIRN